MSQIVKIPVMNSRRTMNVSLTRELEQFVNSKVASGRYQSASEVVREGLRLLEEKDLDRHAAFAQVKQKIAVGLEQARRGELRDGEEVFDELEKCLSKPRRKAS
jgi:antitoxin ParD1/3/4